MPVMTFVTAAGEVAANSKRSGIFAGALHEYVSRPSMVSLYATAAAVGLRATVNNGRETLVDDQEITNKATFPVRPDDKLISFPAAAGDRIVVDLRNTTGAAIAAKVLADIEHVA